MKIAHDETTFSREMRNRTQECEKTININACHPKILQHAKIKTEQALTRAGNTP